MGKNMRVIFFKLAILLFLSPASAEVFLLSVERSDELYTKRQIDHYELVLHLPETEYMDGFMYFTGPVAYVDQKEEPMPVRQNWLSIIGEIQKQRRKLYYFDHYFSTHTYPDGRYVICSDAFPQILPDLMVGVESACIDIGLFYLKIGESKDILSLISRDTIIEHGTNIFTEQSVVLTRIQ